MSKGGKPTKSVFDLEHIREIVELMEQHNLVEVDLQQDDDKIRINRGAPAGGLVPAVAAAPAVAQAAAPANAASAADSDTITIDAPMVGTYYSKSDPKADAYVKVGSVVTPDTIVCIVEAMKVFNEIPAECSGTIVEIMAQDQQAVDFGKPLFRVKPNA